MSEQCTNLPGRQPQARRQLEAWGWTQHEERAWLQKMREEGPTQAQGDGHSPTTDAPLPGRVVAAAREIYRLQTESGERRARPAGRLRGLELPAVGDWVVLQGAADGRSDAIIHGILPRRSKLSRKVAGQRTQEQVVAANVDVIFLMMGLDGDFNLRRIERFLAMTHASGAEPVVVLTKSDLLAPETAIERRLEVEDRAPGVPVMKTSSVNGSGYEALRYYLAPGRTIALVGSSGVGKSTLLNRLVGTEVLRTAAVRKSDDRGRHTTTHRELVRLPEAAGGALLIDNPGVRELQIWAEGDEAIEGAFSDVEDLAVRCRYRDCTHLEEPGCAVLAAVHDGSLDADRLENHRALLREQRFLELRRNEAERRRQERRQGALYKAIQSEKAKRGR